MRIHKMLSGPATRGAQAGFSLIEIMVVVIIIGLLASIVGVSVFDQLAEGRRNAAQTQIKNFQNALDMYRLDCHRYPATEPGLKVLVAGGGGESCKNYKKNGYLAGGKVPLDPWDSPYVYQKPGPKGEEYWIASYGRDGQAGGEGEDADITSNDAVEGE